VWDSYGEALAKLSRNDEAIAAYKKSLELNPDNKVGAEIIKSLQLKN
jgi:tetratricopeptide (TPR) repeat protein